MSEPSRAVCLFLHFELLDECSEMPRHRSRKGVVLVLEALPDGGEPHVSSASGVELALALRDGFRNSIELHGDGSNSRCDRLTEPRRQLST